MDHGTLVASEYEKFKYALTGNKWNKSNLVLG